MRLVRFLAAGKSLVGSKDLTGRYRLPQGRALPKFNSDQSAPSAVDQEPAPVECQESITPKTEEIAAAPAEQAPGPGASAPYPRLATAAAPRRSLFRRLFGWLPGLREKPARGPIPVFSKGPIQTELSLENVKVVRNDLSESDLEVKPANPAKAPPVVSAPLVREPDSSVVAMRATPAGGVNNGPD